MNMKKVLPVLLPVLALIIVGVVAYRLYVRRTETRLQVPPVTAGTEIEELSAAELARLENLGKGVGDYEVVPMTCMSGMGEIRYEISENLVLYSVNANLPTSGGQVYELWLKENLATDFTKVKQLTENKGGLLVSGAVNKDDLPVILEVRRGEEILLTGEIQAR
jgi:hypothetical protein